MSSSYNLQTLRDSNIELMRLVCMVMILVHHLISHVVYNADIILGVAGTVDRYTAFAITINALCYVGVNCFMLITGYYNAKFKWKGLLKLYVILAFYATIQTIVKYYLGQIELSLGTIKDCLLVFSQFSRSNWWFMNCYVIFYLLTPLIQIENLTKKQYHQALILLIIVNVYLGYWWKDYTSGYTVAQFVFMYVIGGYIRRFVNVVSIQKHKAIGVYLISIFLFSLLSIFSHYIEIPHWRAMPYNNPLLVIAAIGFFCLFLRIKIQSKCVNIIADSAISLYLLQNFDIFRLCLNSIGGNTKHFDVMLCMLIITVGFCIVAIMIDQLRRFISFYILRLYDKMVAFNGKR